MPEFAEVEFFRRCWEPAIDAVVHEVDVHAGARVFRGCDPHSLVQALRGQALTSSQAHGKQMLFGFSGGGWLGIHLGMTGALRVEAPGFRTGRHDHLALHQRDRVLVFADSRMFGRIRFDVSPGQPPAWWRELPPGLLTRGFSVEWVAGHLRRRARAPVKGVLLDQSIFPGVGNWMADEILWRLGLHPLTPAGTLLDAAETVRALHDQTRWVARRALATIGVDWRDPPATWLYTHRWAADNRCPRPHCRTLLRREEAAGRTTCWCPTCQPESAGTRPSPVGKPVGTGHRREKPAGR